VSIVLAPLLGKRQIKAAIIESIGGVEPPDIQGIQDTLNSILNRLDVDLSTRASEQTLESLNDKIPSPTANGNLPIALAEDTIGVAKDTTLHDILSQLDVALSTRASEQTLSGIKSSVSVPSSGGTAQLTVGTTPVAAASTPTPAKTVVVKSSSRNSAEVCIGFGSDVSVDTGFCIDPGESVIIDIDDVSKIYLVAGSDSKVYLLWVN